MLRVVGSNRQPGPTLDDVFEAAKVTSTRISQTPLKPSHSFSRITGREIWLKAECLQRTGSFKIRGATNVVSRIPGRPVAAASAGNHAQGVALAASWFGCPCTVFMPASAPLPKVAATRDYGAEVRLVDGPLEETVARALEFSEETGARFIHPYDDPLIVAGQATLGLELVEQLPSLGTVVVPTGGGGLLAGVALAVKAHLPEARVIGVEIDVAAVYAESRRAGRPVRLSPRPTVADGINVTVPSEMVFSMVEELVDDLVVVNEGHTTSALTLVLERAKLMVEPAGVVGVAAVLEGLVGSSFPEPLVVVLTGGNIDLLLLGKMVRHGLEASGRYADFRVWIPDQPGQLVRVLQAIAEIGGNVVEVEHHREGFGLPFGKVEVMIAVETQGPEHTALIREALRPYEPSA
ncbi:MAG: threonine ammonia-lyase [Acidimicrobiia bacterium]|nr:MAG: threonine ammonia-lyase [Acidimicrobiia bacterium]